ncbi:anti-sigma factor [Nakamurella sp. GG22]
MDDGAGTGDAMDRARIDHLAGEGGIELDADDRAELDALRDLLADPTLWAEPPPGLEDTVVAGITAAAAQQRAADAPEAPIDLASRRPRWKRPAFLVAAAAAVVAVALSAVLLLRDPSAERRFDVALAATELAPGASGTATMLKKDSGWEIHLDATSLPRLDGGRFYQAWLRNEAGVLVPIGTFNEGTDVILWAGVSPQDFPAMTITREEADGEQDSSGQRVLAGTAVEQ